MLKKLELRITVYNLIILVLFFTIFCITIYLVTQTSLNNSVEKALVKRLNAFRFMDKETVQNRKGKLDEPFFISKYKFEKTSMFDLNIRTDFIEYDENMEPFLVSNLFLKEDVNSFKESLHVHNKILSVTVNDRSYKIISKKIIGMKGYVQIIYDYESGKAFMINLLKMLIVVGLSSICMLAVISVIFAKKSIVPVQKSWKQQKDFVADASHELRTPLSVMKINLEAAMDDENSTIKDNMIWLNNVVEETDTIAKLIEELLLLAKMDSNELMLGKERINMSDLVKNEVKSMKDLANQSSISLNVESDEDLYMDADKSKIKQLIRILIDNAIKYNKKDGKIKVKLSQNKDKLRLEVEDTGVGISKENIGKVFDRFFMEDKARSKEKGSSGLGLSIAQWIVKSHDGVIWVKSTKGKSSTFVVEFKV